MYRIHEKLWLGWDLAAILGLLLLGSIARGQDAGKPIDLLPPGMAEMQRDLVGVPFSGPQLDPGSHMIWVAGREDSATTPYSLWRSYGPFEVMAGQKYLVTIRGTGTPTIQWKAWGKADPNSHATVYYLNRTGGDDRFSIAVIPANSAVPNMVISAMFPAGAPRDARHAYPHKIHLVPLDQGKTYVIDMRSSDFDTYLMLEDLRGELLASNDDNNMVLTQDAMNSRITFRPAATATYRLIAAAFSKGEGNYAITIREVPAMMRVEDRLTADDATQSDAHYKSYDVSLTAGRRYYIDLDGNDFATYLKLLDSAGALVSFDEGGGTSLSTRIVFEARTSGVYSLVATSFTEGATGAFSLTVREEKMNNEE